MKIGGVARLLAIVAVGVRVVAAQSQGARPPCDDPIPAGFVDQARVSWSGPWVFRPRSQSQDALPWVGERPADRSGARPKSATVAIHFDDGRAGLLRIEQRDCMSGEPCASDDCCSASLNPYDSHWLIASDESGKQVFREHFWAPYELVEVVPVDLVDGPGDEVIIVRTWAHASPSVGFALEVWKVGGARPIDLSGRVIVGTWITFPFTNWRANLVIDTAQVKPRSIEMSRQLGIVPCGTLTSVDRTEAARLGRPAKLMFDTAARKYLVR